MYCSSRAEGLPSEEQDRGPGVGAARRGVELGRVMAMGRWGELAVGCRVVCRAKEYDMHLSLESAFYFD